MDENEYVCPLCCEELDISDRQFFPCKCGYQVCMWCWHRIRESESGLCPACRTPYGDDPHEFSAVDVEEVLKANKEKEAAAKRERDRQRHLNDGNSSDGEGIAALTGGNLRGQMEVPKDRTQLANMRVIRRNLVYAVGLPPTIASEDTLRKAEYFGQYGKISKIVLNRSQAVGSDTRRASASAYVTFLHKEDTLACILALDGFYLDGRNIRASYGTSKYCSAFIKNVRCNNPECTYLHQMGDVEDTFTKQEIQAGYVTSGRDVLARQQQIVQQALSAASGAAGSSHRRRAGGGGPSSTGKASAHPVFPPPSYDEPAKSSSSSLVPPPPPPPAVGHTRSVTTGTGFPSIAAANGPPAPSNIARSSSTGGMSTGSDGSVKAAPPKGTIAPAPPKGAIASAAQVARKGSIASAAAQPAPSAGPSGATAASVVAGMHSVSVSSEPPAPHTTLTPLTPLKRSTGSKGAVKAAEPASRPANDATTKLTSLRPAGTKKPNGTKPSGQPASNPPAATAVEPANAEVDVNAPAATKGRNRPKPASTIGGAVIAAPTAVAPPIVGGLPGVSIGSNAGPSPLSELAGENGLGDLGGEVFTGPLKSSGASSAIGSGAPIGSSKEKWNPSPIGGDTVLSSNPGGLWSNGGHAVGGPSHGLGQGHTIRPSGSGGVIGGSAGTIGGGFQNSGSSALASMLGINLPTGSGSLRESPNLWSGSGPASHTPISALNGTSVPVQGVIGQGASAVGGGGGGGGLIGGVTIGGGPAPLGTGTVGNGGNKSDLALLQSLLPGVHITSGSSYSQGSSFGTIGGNSGNWNSAPGPNHAQHFADSHNINMGEPRHPPQWNGGFQAQLGGAAAGAIGQSASKQSQRAAPGNIW